MVTATVIAVLLSGGFSRPGLELRDEGTSRGTPVSVDFVGATISCAAAVAGVVTCTLSAGGAVSFTTVEIDFGTSAQFVATTTITDAAVSSASKVTAWQAGNAATGRQADENEMDSISCSVIPATGTFTLICTNARSVTHGLFKVHYTVG